MASLGFGTNVSGSGSYNAWGSGVSALKLLEEEEKKKKLYPYGQDVYGPENIPTSAYGQPTPIMQTTPAPSTPTLASAPKTAGSLATVDRTKMSAYPTSWNPATQAGRKWDGSKWVEVPSGADVTWNAGTNQYYFRGVPITESEVQGLLASGPSALTGGGAPGYMSGSDINANLANLGFGQQRAPIAPPTLAGVSLPAAAQVAAPPPIVAPTVTPEQGGFQDFDRLEQSIFESRYRPVERELARQAGLADQRMAAQLAQAGIAESGTGVGQRARQADEFQRQQAAAATDAANQAATQRYGMEYTQSMDNARMRQEANLANAGFSLQAQSLNAQNLLTVGVTNAQLANQMGIAGAQIQSQQQIAQAQLYLQSMGLNYEMQDSAQRNYLALLGLQQQDLARMDAFELESLSLFYNTYLKQVAIMVQAGQGSFGKTDSSSSSMDFNIGF